MMRSSIASFESQLDTLSRQHAAAKEKLARLKTTNDAKDYAEACKQLNKTIGQMEDGLAEARKQLRR